MGESGFFSTDARMGESGFFSTDARMGESGFSEPRKKEIKFILKLQETK
jgi:hypothetical protein